jgi:hypothetical protein
VIYGGASLPSTIDLNSSAAGLTVYGDDVGGESGHGLAVGDINADGTDDLIIGAIRADSPGRVDAGETYVIFGGGSLPSTIDLNSTAADLTVYGDDASDFSGHALAAGDINGDGSDDLIIGAPYADPAGGGDAGETYVIFGGGPLPSTVDLNATAADLTVYGADAGDVSGISVAAADIDGDGTDDLIIAARYADPAGGSEAGETYVIFGGGSLPSTIDLNSTAADLTVYGDDGGDISGNAVAGGDINGDGVDDLIIAAPHASPAGGVGAGEIYVIYGGTSLPSTIDLNSTAPSLTIYGDDAGDHFGSGIDAGVAAGDINGDGVDDLAIGASLADPAGGSEAGEAYVIYGGASLPSTIDLNSTAADLTVYGDDAGDNFSYAVATGNINGDGTDDVIIGARGADPAGGVDAGETYVIYGAASQPVGGIAELPDVAEGSEWPVPNSIALVAGLATALLALTAGAWYGRRRWVR